MANDNSRDNDLVLAPGEFAYVLDTTKGLVNVNVGPYKTSMAGTDQPVVFDKTKMRFERCKDVPAAIQRDLVAPEGFYLALYNPAHENRHPMPGKSSISEDLHVGHRINIAGPANFALWPGQMADVIRGHHLRSNQYLLAQVYNDVQAGLNWKTAVMKPASGADATPVLQTFTPGQQIVIKGTDVAFFIPPTGIKVVADGGTFVREAVTLERLEYCILLDEDGNKRFVQGPAVVFPEPTETFVVGKDQSRKFRAIELNDTTGIYVKVIADYKDESGEHRAGDELFITGKQQAIYYQREEHSVIRYGDQTKHYAVAVPAGEGRYVLNRQTGVITLARGPRMLLCDPRTEVIVRRVLSQKEAGLLYPGNLTVLNVNKELEGQARQSSPSQYEAGRVMSNTMAMTGGTSYMALNAMDEVAAASRQLAGDTFTRGTGFTPPRMITLDTKFDGAVQVNVWPGYAVLIVNKSGGRRVAIGPETVLLEYDETLAMLSLSTGTPKTSASTLDTVYLRVGNNRISDLLVVETKDFVQAKLRVSYRVNFEGEDFERWFAVENFIGLLCDHTHSLLRNAVKKVGIEQFYGSSVGIVRDTILGEQAEDGSRPGMMFAENNMHIYDVEVLSVQIDNPVVAKLLSDAQISSISQAVTIAQEERGLDVKVRSEEVRRKLAEAVASTEQVISASQQITLAAQLEVSLQRLENEMSVEAERLNKRHAEQEALTNIEVATLEREKARADQDHKLREATIDLELKKLVKETEEIVKRSGAMNEKLGAALVTLSDNAMVERISKDLAGLAAMQGVSAADVLGKLFKGTPLESVMTALASRANVAAVAE